MLLFLQRPPAKTKSTRNHQTYQTIAAPSWGIEEIIGLGQVLGRTNCVNVVWAVYLEYDLTKRAGELQLYLYLAGSLRQSVSC